jgi:hypothetical protein
LNKIEESKKIIIINKVIIFIFIILIIIQFPFIEKFIDGNSESTKNIVMNKEVKSVSDDTTEKTNSKNSKESDTLDAKRNIIKDDIYNSYEDFFESFFTEYLDDCSTSIELKDTNLIEKYIGDDLYLEDQKNFLKTIMNNELDNRYKFKGCFVDKVENDENNLKIKVYEYTGEKRRFKDNSESKDIEAICAKNYILKKDKSNSNKFGYLIINEEGSRCEIEKVEENWAKIE